MQTFLRTVSAWNDGVQSAIFRPNHLAPTFSPAQVIKPPRFNAYYAIEDLRPVDGATWRLELAGRISDKRPWTAQQIYALPEQEVIIRYVCVEGWVSKRFRAFATPSRVASLKPLASTK